MPASLCRRALSTAVICLAAVAAAVAPASAQSLAGDASSCTDQSLTQPFAPWLDPMSYTLAPDGAIEDGAGAWTLSGGAAPATGNEPFQVHGAGDSTSLALPAGSSATSAAMCVDLEHPTTRFFARRSGGSMLGALRVDVLYQDLSGATQSLPIGVVMDPLGRWQPTLPMALVTNLLSLVQGGDSTVALRFVPQGDSSWSIDDIYVDPFHRG